MNRSGICVLGLTTPIPFTRPTSYLYKGEKDMIRSFRIKIDFMLLSHGVKVLDLARNIILVVRGSYH